MNLIKSNTKEIFLTFTNNARGDSNLTVYPWGNGEGHTVSMDKGRCFDITYSEFEALKLAIDHGEYLEVSE